MRKLNKQTQTRAWSCQLEQEFNQINQHQLAIQKNIENSIVFDPQDVDDFVRQFENNVLQTIVPNKFIKSFNRDSIMSSLCSEVVELA